MDTQGGKKRKSLRLEGYDYSSVGAYFVTLIVNEYKCIFGEVISGEVVLTEFGRIAREEWFNSSKVRLEIILHEDEFVVMPNHVHGIVWIEHPYGLGRKNSKNVDVRATGRLPIRQVEWDYRGPKPKSLSAFIAGYKSSITRRINKFRGTPGRTVWMKNFHDRIIRNERELRAIQKYIQNNPLKWELERNYLG